ncbi:MAG: PH domain-containing protein [Propionicimonas sp.]|nr:PH domain-containing protein [Propionicimonas sp.]
MGLPAKFLGADEVEVLHLRTHGKALVAPTLVLLVVAVASGIGLAAIPPSWQPWAGWAEFALAGIVLLAWVVVPYLRWLTTTYTLTNRRIITRRGIIHKTGHDLPLSRINNVSYARSLLDRMLGCGTLVLTTAAEAPVELDDIPDVERVHVLMTELLFAQDTLERQLPPDAGE